jgi:tRNA (adenine37-N6)-methyltransferase
VRNKVRPPKVEDKKGLFATRTPNRPNPIGLTLCKLDGIVNGTTLLLSQHDLIDRTPVLDVKVSS